MQFSEKGSLKTPLRCTTTSASASSGCITLAKKKNLPFQQFDKNSSISGNVSVQSNSHSGTFDSSNIINNNDDGLDNGTITQSHWWRCSHSHHHQTLTDTHTKDHMAQIHSDCLHILKCLLEKTKGTKNVNVSINCYVTFSRCKPAC